MDWRNTMMRKIATFDIFGSSWDAFKTDEIDPSLAGYCDYDKQIICVNKELSGQPFDETILHEFLHALFLRLSFKQSIPHELEEVMIDQISRGISECFSMKVKKK
jgi:hypothetical protein